MLRLQYMGISSRFCHGNSAEVHRNITRGFGEYLGGIVRQDGRGVVAFSPPVFRVLSGDVFPDRYAVLAGEGEKVVPVYPVLSPGQPERRQVTLLYPAQDGYFADTAMPGDDTGGEIFGVCPGSDYSQVWPPSCPLTFGL